jgi:hypothetical protein
MFGTLGVPLALWLSNIAIAGLLLMAGVVLFTKAESNAMDTV